MTAIALSPKRALPEFFVPRSASTVLTCSPTAGATKKEQSRGATIIVTATPISRKSFAAFSHFHWPIDFKSRAE
jgi:hypothetical protein